MRRKFLYHLYLVLLLFAFSNRTEAQNWYNISWSYRKTITVNASKVGSGTHNNFPVLIQITDGDIKTKALSSGNDMLFTSSDGITKLNHEIESYSSSTGSLMAWVQIPSLSSSSNTVIYMYYGNSGAANQQNVTATWDASFRGVYHLNNVFTDATSNARNGTNSGTSSTTGKIANGRSFNGSSKITISGLMSNPINVTLSGWANLTTRDVTGSDLVSIGDYVCMNADDATNGYLGAFYDAGWGLTKSSPKINTAGTGWHYFVYTFTSGAQALYLDGVLKGSGAWSGAISYSTQGTNTIIGAHGNGSTNFDWVGTIDEVRVAGTARSAGWISTEYNNQSSPSTFFTVGSEATVPLPVTFVSVNAFEKNNGIDVRWDIAFEDGVQEYQVEKSTDGVAFIKVATIPAMGTVPRNQYSWFDQNIAEANYYRIRSVDFDGKTKLSTTAVATTYDQQREFTVFPNPVKNTGMRVRASNLEKGRYSLSLIDIQGRELNERIIHHDGGMMNETIEVKKLKKGMYYVRIQNERNVLVQMILVE
jgi:hypothetical protein